MSVLSRRTIRNAEEDMRPGRCRATRPAARGRQGRASEQTFNDQEHFNTIEPDLNIGLI
jgi:hypothetical protein